MCPALFQHFSSTFPALVLGRAEGAWRCPTCPAGVSACSFAGSLRPFTSSGDASSNFPGTQFLAHCQHVFTTFFELLICKEALPRSAAAPSNDALREQLWEAQKAALILERDKALMEVKLAQALAETVKMQAEMQVAQAREGRPPPPPSLMSSCSLPDGASSSSSSYLPPSSQFAHYGASSSSSFPTNFMS